MKKISSLFFTVLFITNNLFSQIPNSGFENWTAVGSYQIPDGWATMNNTTASYSLFTATKGSPGSPGASYLKLTAKMIGGTMHSGMAVCGKMDTLTSQALSGVPYSQRPYSFEGKWQHMVYGNVNGSISILLSKYNSLLETRDTVAFLNYTLSGMAMSWANFSLPLTYRDSLQFPDSCMIVLKACKGYPATNDYLWVDNLSFAGTVPLVTPPNLTGITENMKKDFQMTLFPNPSENKVTLSFSHNNSSAVNIQIQDISGKTVQEQTLTHPLIGTNTIILETNHLEKGMYMVTLKTGTSQNSLKLLVE